MAFIDDFSAHLARFQAAPFLFVGSGISLRYLKLETWENLLRKFSALTGKQYEYFKSSSNNDLPTIASEIAREFFEIWWNDPSFEESRARFSSMMLDKSSPLKVEIAKYITEKSAIENIPEEYLTEVKALKEVVIDGIITTNWDSFLEEIFQDNKVFVGQSDLLFETIYSVDETYKIHGSCEYPNSLVLTKEDYEDYNEKFAYLASKLLTIFAEHPVIFLGYSLADENIRQIINSLLLCVPKEKISSFQDRFIFIKWDKNIKSPQISKSIILVNENQMPVTLIESDSFTEIFQVLGNEKRRFPVGQLRKIKEYVYEIVKSRDPGNKIYVKDFEDGKNLKDHDVVIGVGAFEKIEMSEKGYLGLNRDNLIEYFLDRKKNFDNLTVIHDVIPKEIRKNNKFPIYYFLSTANLILPDNSIDFSTLDPKYRKLVPKDLDVLTPVFSV